MKFVHVSKAKGLKVGEPVFTLNDAGVYESGKLHSRSETAKGTELTFEVPQYFDENAPMIKPNLVKNITHVAVIKDRKEVVEAGSAKELQSALAG